jgi:hypothetical protein
MKTEIVVIQSTFTSRIVTRDYTIRFQQTTVWELIYVVCPPRKRRRPRK